MDGVLFINYFRNYLFIHLPHSLTHKLILSKHSFTIVYECPFSGLPLFYFLLLYKIHTGTHPFPCIPVTDRTKKIRLGLHFILVADRPVFMFLGHDH